MLFGHNLKLNIYFQLWEDPMNSGLSVCQCLRNTFYSELTLTFFSLKLGDNEGSEVAEPDFSGNLGDTKENSPKRTQ